MPLPHTLARLTRLHMPLVRCGVPGVPLLGRYNYAVANPALSDHAHAGQMEICFLVRGSQNYRLGKKDYRLTGGDVFITFPNERHSSGNQPQEKGVLYWMTLQIPTTGTKRDFLGLSAAQSRGLLAGLLGLKVRWFRGSWKMQTHLDAVTVLYHRPPDPLQAYAIANQVGAFLLEVVACGHRADAGEARGRLPEAARRYVRGHFDEPTTVPCLAAAAGLSVARFKARFKQEAGIPPGEFILRTKVEEAQRRLSGSQATVTQIAFDLGFSTSQHFATVFKRFTGERPSTYRASESFSRHVGTAAR